jgi:hypothetical protein
MISSNRGRKQKEKKVGTVIEKNKKNTEDSSDT